VKARARIAGILALGFLGVIGRLSAETQRVIRCQGASYTYRLEIPPGNQAKPAILLLHGSGGNGKNMLDPWKAFGIANGIVLIAPTLPQDAAFEAGAPSVFRCIVDDARTAAKVDPKRIYVLGHSMGGYLAYDAAMFESEYFAAIAVHAAAITPEYDGILAHARRKIPIAIFVGDRDPLASLDAVRRTRDLLTSAGFPVRYEELPGHDHDYDAESRRINREAWEFFEAHPLP
jgi:poly(3-hydroxybutyrate) depolymerase